MYGVCDSCGSVVYTESFDLDDYTSTTSDTAFYGERYWRDHVPDDLGLPGLAERARTDLSTRAVYYLDRVLRYVAPGDSLLELGCAPGCVAYLLGQAGVQVTGIEMGTATVEFVRRQFGLDVVEGPVERVDLARPVDAVIGVDVLEHLPQPLDTLRACRKRLTDTGVLILQTPCYRGEQPDWSMLVPAEHLFLYTEHSVRTLLAQAGFTVVEVGPSLFPYDMWIVATPGATATARKDTLAGLNPQTAALITLYRRSAAQANEQAAVERDRSIHQAQAAAAGSELAAVRADQDAKERLITSISQELAATRADQQAKAELITAVSRELAAVRADQRAKAELIAAMSQELAEARADQHTKAELIARLTDASSQNDAPT